MIEVATGIITKATNVENSASDTIDEAEKDILNISKFRKNMDRIGMFSGDLIEGIDNAFTQDRVAKLKKEGINVIGKLNTLEINKVRSNEVGMYSTSNRRYVHRCS